MEKNKVHKKVVLNDKILIVLFAVLIVMTIVLVLVKIMNANVLDANEPIVTKLHNYFNTDDLSNCDGLFNYSNKKVEYSSISNDIKLCLAYHKSNIKDVEEETYKAKKGKEICEQDGMTFKVEKDSTECVVTKIKKSIIDDSYERIFGKEIEDIKSFNYDNLHICYLKDDFYYCGLSETYTYTLGSESQIYRVIKKAVEKSSEIVIYDYFLKINENKCYKYYTTLTSNNDCTNNYDNKNKIKYNFLKKYGTKYKHIFRKNENNDYYWVSSEPID